MIQMLPILPTFPIGSLTTLLIAHLATLQLGDQLEFYVTLTGPLKIPIFKCLAGANISFLLPVVQSSSLKLQTHTNSLPLAFSSRPIETHE